MGTKNFVTKILTKRTTIMKTMFIIPVIMALMFISYVSVAGDAAIAANLRKATFAGGCFWCMEKPFEEAAGVYSVTSGYTSGNSNNPTYQNYASDGHIEAVQILYDPRKISYDRLLDIFWRQIDPTDSGGQFVDRGHAYTTAIFYNNKSQMKKAEQSKTNLSESGVFKKPLVTPILPATEFYPAEEYHQDYYKKNPIRYKFYRFRAGRDQFLEKIWQNKNRE